MSVMNATLNDYKARDASYLTLIHLRDYVSGEIILMTGLARTYRVTAQTISRVRLCSILKEVPLYRRKQRDSENKWQEYKQ